MRLLGATDACSNDTGSLLKLISINPSRITIIRRSTQYSLTEAKLQYELGHEPGRHEIRRLDLVKRQPAPPGERREKLGVQIDRAVGDNDGVVGETMKTWLPRFPANAFASLDRQGVERYVATLHHVAPNALDNLRWRLARAVRMHGP
jgi:hypothetical protein